MAYQTLCKQRYLGEGESVPFMLDGGPDTARAQPHPVHPQEER